MEPLSNGATTVGPNLSTHHCDTASFAGSCWLSSTVGARSTFSAIGSKVHTWDAEESTWVPYPGSPQALIPLVLTLRSIISHIMNTYLKSASEVLDFFYNNFNM
ncbi:hypothetical protein GOBAR_DD35759 [Gossypium barbadense]|nr:hypothetical protein GOBAR_DD35759 [Gossypium barbadense]